MCCPKCGVIFDDNFEKHGFITSNIKIPNISGFKSVLRLHKQRFLCKHCNKAFTLTSNIVNYGCFISNNTKYQIALDLTKKRSEVDISKDNNVSPNTVERVMDSFYDSQKLYKNHLFYYFKTGKQDHRNFYAGNGAKKVGGSDKKTIHLSRGGKEKERKIPHVPA